MITSVTHHPVPLMSLVPTAPMLIGTTDASKHGMGGFWLPTVWSTPPAHPIIWRAPFSPPIRQALATADNPTGSITNSDLELTALLTGVALGTMIPTSTCHVLHCTIDNTPALAWSTRGSTSSNAPPAYLLRLHSQLARQRDFTLRSVFTPGMTSTLADFCSHSFHMADGDLLHAVNQRFPSQPCWNLAHLTNALLLHMTSALSKWMLPWESAGPELM